MVVHQKVLTKLVVAVDINNDDERRGYRIGMPIHARAREIPPPTKNADFIMC